LARANEYVFSVAVVILLVFSVVEYVQITSLETQVSQLQEQVQNIPNPSGQISQLQQQVNQLSSELASHKSQTEAIRIFDLCVAATPGCQTNSVFEVAVANDGNITIPATSFGIGVGTNGTSSYAFASFTICTNSPLIPGGPAVLLAFSFWSNVSNKSGTFSQGATVEVSVCTSSGACASGISVVRA